MLNQSKRRTGEGGVLDGGELHAIARCLLEASCALLTFIHVTKARGLIHSGFMALLMVPAMHAAERRSLNS